ncbi:hypothetical protein SCHPADRAFT_900977 [Schizopora paradoxa]|uniref:Uncharacterized protein n=1 Tax=Schizopora paradoxa TaxID=27342 RepID=A0A0H2RY59_9AGAM|nr:hypothetical protein SCHPADRAFT_900977 [Schizopora paradoxa]
MQGYGGGGAPPGGHPAQLYPYMYAPQPGQPNPMYGAPPGMPPYPVAPSQNSHYMSSPYGVPPNLSQSQPQAIVPPEGRMPRPKRFTDRSKPREERQERHFTKPLRSAMKKSNSLSVPPSNHPQYHHSREGSGSGLSLWRSRTTQGPKVPFPDEEDEEIRMRHSRKELPISRIPSGASGGVLTRTRTASDPQHPRSRANSTSRPRSRTAGRYYHTPGHLFLQISGTNKLSMSSVVNPRIVEDIRERVLTMWPEGVERSTYHEEINEFDSHFVGTPWTSKGNLGLIAMRLILELFTLLARRGYICTSAIDTGLSTGYPRFVFSSTNEDPDAQFFMIAFSDNRRKIKLINHPDILGQSMSEVIREEFPRRLISASWGEESDYYKIEVSRWDSESMTGLFIATILQFCTSQGYKLDCSIPLVHSGILGILQGKKELWIMKRFPLYVPNQG